MAIKHIIDCELMTAEGLVKTKANLVKSEDLVSNDIGEEDAVKSEGRCQLSTENAIEGVGVILTFNRLEMSKLLRFMEG